MNKMRLADEVKDIPEKGIYTLLIHVPTEREVEIGSLGVKRLKDGYYLYTGSALGKGALSLRGRIRRHMGERKRLRWHIDYLLSEGDVKVIGVIAAETDERLECKINQALKAGMKTAIPIPGFGSSDCRAGCESHLLYLEWMSGDVDPLLRRVVEVYIDEAGGRVFALRLDSRSEIEIRVSPSNS